MEKPIVLEFARAEQADDPFAFRFSPQSYLLRQEGGIFASTTFPWDPSLQADLQALRQPGCPAELRQRMGERLRHFLQAASWSEYERRILAAQREGQRVVLVIRSAAAELYSLPWELLTLGSSGQHLGELSQVNLRYEWPAAHNGASSDDGGATASESRAEGRILLAWSAAGGVVPAPEHASAIRDAAQTAAFPSDTRLEVLANASAAGLSARLSELARTGQPVEVLHLLAHGGVTGQACGLVLDSETSEGGRAVLDASRLRRLLEPFAKSLRLVVLSVCDSGDSGPPGSTLGSLAQSLHRIGIAAVVASRYPLSVTGSITLAQVLYRQLLVELSSLETALLAARRRLMQDSEGCDWASLQLYARHPLDEELRPVVMRPFRGLLSFQPEHARFYFGRDTEVQDLLTKLTALAEQGRPRLLIVSGASGSGKSSLVLAGAVPRWLASHPGSPLLRLRPATAQSALDAFVAAEGQAPPALIVVDQFEEIFTQIESPAARSALAQRLWRLSQSSAGHCVILTIRIDFLGRGNELQLDDQGLRLDAIAYADPHRILVAQLSAAAMQQVITEPARLAGLRLEDGLLQRLLKDVAEEPGALPLLEDTLDVLWQRRRGPYLTDAAYDAIGGISGALKGRADALIAGLSETEARLARRLLVRLVHVAPDVATYTRRAVAAKALRPQQAADVAVHERVLARLLDARLLVSSGEGDKQSIEVAHEALLRQWPRLQDWVRADQIRLAELRQLDDWLADWKQYGTLLLGEPLSIAQKIEKEQPDEISEPARALIALSSKRAKSRSLFRRFLQVSLVFVAIYLFIVVRIFFKMTMRDEIFALFIFVASSVLLNVLSIPALIAVAWRWRK
jgi:hypothetical protein